MSHPSSSTPTLARSTSQMSRPSTVIPEAPELGGNVPFRIAPVPGKGKGIIATQPIRKGTVVLSEEPLFTLGPERTNSSILVALSAHSREEQRFFFALSNVHGRRMLPALGIFETNALPCQVAPGSDHMGIFLTGARFNHSCNPNAGRSWDAQSQAMVFRVLKNVQAGEELSVNYVDLFEAREERRAELQALFGFDCVCEACGLEGEQLAESDKRRTTIRRLFDEVGTCAKEPTLGMRKVQIALKLLREEHLVHYEASFYFDAFQFCVLVSDFANAKLWARKAWESSCSISGSESAAARTFKMYWANPRMHPFAGRLPKMTLAGPESLSP